MRPEPIINSGPAGQIASVAGGKAQCARLRPVRPARLARSGRTLHAARHQTSQRRIRRLVDIRRLDVDFCRRELLERHPLAWLIEVNGFVVDARWMPPEIQVEAVGRGLIPPLPAPESGDPPAMLEAARAVDAA